MNQIPRSVRARMLFRSFAIQGSWNFETLIGTGFAYALLPALRFIYGGRKDILEAALARHVELFNSHPYFATIAIGAVSKLEAEGAEPAVIEKFKTALRGSLGTLGDRLIWMTWRPMAVLLGLVLLQAGAPWWIAIGIFLFVYNAMHLVVRIAGLNIGTEAGLEIGRDLREAPIQRVIDVAKRVSSVLVGAGVVFAAAPAASDPVAALATGAAVAVGLGLGVRSRPVMITILAVFAILALALGFAGYGA